MVLTYTDLIRAIRDTGLPCTYSYFVKPPPLPYTVIQYAYGSDFIADNQNYTEVGNYQLELYHVAKDPLTEKLIENKLRELRLPFRKSEMFLDTEELYQIVYEIQLIGG